MNELKVGLLTLMAIASVVVVSLKITSNKASFGDFIEYRTVLNDATGIYENSSIKVAGIVGIICGIIAFGFSGAAGYKGGQDGYDLAREYSVPVIYYRAAKVTRNGQGSVPGSCSFYQPSN